MQSLVFLTYFFQKLLKKNLWGGEEKKKERVKNVPFDEIKNVSTDVNGMWLMWKSFFVDVLNIPAPIINVKVKGSRLSFQ